MTRCPLLLGALLVACDGGALDPSSNSDVEPPARFADAGALPDGTALLADAAPDAAPPPDPCRTGSAIGLVCAPDGDTPIAEAEVTAATTDCAGEPLNITTRSDGRGRFRLDGLMPGPTRVTVRTGGFVAFFEVQIVAGVEVSVGRSSKICLDARASRMATLTGDYDRIEVLLQGLGFEPDVYCGRRGGHRGARRLLGDPEALAEYRVLFINCASGIDQGFDDADSEVLVDNLRDFVKEGGSVYISDLAGAFLSRAWPDAVELSLALPEPTPGPACCTCLDDCAPECAVNDEAGDAPLCPPTPAACEVARPVRGGGREGSVPALVQSDFLAAYLDRRAIDVVFNFAGWAQIESVAADVEVLVADELGRPLMILFQPYGPGGGRVAYTSFHTHAQATEQMEAILSALVFQL